MQFLEPEYVAEKTLKAILTNEKTLFLPKRIKILFLLKG